MNDWSVPFKKIVRGFLFEDLVIYGAGLCFALLADVFRFALFIIGLSQDAHEFNVGLGQGIVALLFLGLMVRKIAQLRYWSVSEDRQDSQTSV
jgi:hypothetical protein